MLQLSRKSDRRTIESIRRWRRWGRPVGVGLSLLAAANLLVGFVYLEWFIEVSSSIYYDDPAFQIGRFLGESTALAFFGAILVLVIGLSLLDDFRTNRLLLAYVDRLDALGQLEGDGSLRPQ